MKLDDILEEWARDCQIDDSNSANYTRANLNIPKLHQKYLKLLSQARVKIKEMEEDFKQLKLSKYEFYADGPTKEQIALGWKVPPKGRILKTELPMYLEADPDISKFQVHLAIQNEKIRTLEEIIKQVNAMQWIFRNDINYKKFCAGEL